jgi:tetratricopeptide (TPR) repeat protein
MSLDRTLTAFACGRYTVVRPLGAGGEKLVYLVHDTALDREAALALLKPGTLDADGGARLRREARAIARLGSHPHVVAVFDIGEHEGSPFVVTEHVAGGDLRGLLLSAGGRLDPAHAVEIATQILRALAFVHGQGIVHRDLKPDNVLLTLDGVAKLGDFGIAHATAGAGAAPVAGTPHYMAPEQLRGETVDARADLYALGCTLFELVTGAPPFPGSSLGQIVAGHLGDPPPSARASAPALLSGVDELIRALLAKAPADRPRDAAETLRRLDDAQHATGEPARPPARAADRVIEASGLVARGDLAGAARTLQAHLGQVTDPEARLVLSRILQARGELDAARAQLELALAEFTELKLVRRAALAAARLGTFYSSFVGNRGAARSWFARAWHLLKNEGPCVERGWIVVEDVGCNTDDPGQLLEKTEIALEMARRFGDGDLEAKALADGGLALVERGEVASGMEKIDEALAIVTSGGVRDRVVAGRICCAFFTACTVAGDLARCDSWRSVLHERNLLGDKGMPILNTHCDSVYGGLLCSLGRWREAESALQRGMELAGTIAARNGRSPPTCALAQLRILQGRLEEAEQLLVGKDDYLDALVPMAQLHLARGDHELAAATARRGLRMLGSNRTRAIGLLTIIVEAELGRGDVAAASAAAAELAVRVEGTQISSLCAEAACARARVRAASGERTEAIAELEAALAALGDAELPLHKLKLHVELARLHGSTDKRAALVEARAAAAIQARLDAPMPRAQSALLQSLGIGVAGGAAELVEQEGGGWCVERAGARHPLGASSGARMLARLVGRPLVEQHVLDLIASLSPTAGGGRDTSRARARRMIEALRSALGSAETLGDTAAVDRLKAEVEAAVAELAGSRADVARAEEDARALVASAIREAIERIEKLDAPAGQALARRVRLGLLCAYEPSPDDEIVWTARSVS